MVALIGPNGAGKSTCFGILNGQVRPDAGTIRLAGEMTRGLSSGAYWRRGVGRTFQVTATFVSMTARENLQVTLLSHHRRLMRPYLRARDWCRAEASRLLDLVGIADDADRPCGELAYGELKRLEFAIALAGKPRLILMDEPTAGMAPLERIATMRLVADISKTQDIGVLFTEHDMDVVFEHADRIIVLNRGSILAQGEVDAIRADPAVRAAYLGDGLLYGAEQKRTY